MAGLALIEHLSSGGIDARNFFADYAAYAQFLIALPLFIVGERVVSRSTREAAREFLDTGIISAADGSVVASHRNVPGAPSIVVTRISLHYHRVWTRGRRILPELLSRVDPHLAQDRRRQPHGADFHVVRPHVARRVGVGGGAADPELLVASTGLEDHYLDTLSVPDIAAPSGARGLASGTTGGIGFISEVQAKFAIIIFAYGISNVAAVIAYKVAIEHAPLTLPPVWGPAVGFIIGAPLLFTLPLLMFTKQLFRTKRRAIALYRKQVLRRALAFESRWLSDDINDAADSAPWLSNMNNIASMFARVQDMRVVPFDFKSGMQLVASTIGSVAAVLPLLQIEGPIKIWLELLSTILKRGG